MAKGFVVSLFAVIIFCALAAFNPMGAIIGPDATNTSPPVTMEAVPTPPTPTLPQPQVGG